MVQVAKKRQRTCVVCGAQDNKGALYRIVRMPDGAIEFDPSGRKPGRGAYVCSSACFAAAQKARKLDRALRAKLTEDDYTRIGAELARRCDAATEMTEE